MQAASRLPVLIILVCSLSTFASAGGSNTFDFLRNDVGARAAAVGGSFVALTDDPNMIFYNPAGLTSLSRQKLSVGFFKHLMDVNSGYASFGSEIQGFGFAGAGIVYTNYGEFTRTGEEGQGLGTFSAHDFALAAAYGGGLATGLTYGVGAKFIFSSIDDIYSSAVAVDLGMQYVAVPERLRAGISLMNLGTQLDPFVNTRESLPLDLKVGVAITPEHLPASILVNLHKLNEEQDNIGDRFKAFSVGAEFSASPNVFLRFGYNNERRRELKIGQSTGLAGFSIGAGFTTGMYGVDYAFNSYGPIGALHRISISF